MNQHCVELGMVQRLLHSTQLGMVLVHRLSVKMLSIKFLLRMHHVAWSILWPTHNKIIQFVMDKTKAEKEFLLLFLVEKY